MAAGMQPEEFIAAITALWSGSTTLSTNVPGGIHLTYAPGDAPAGTYAVLTVEPQDAILLSNRDWLQDVKFTIDVLSQAAMDATARATINTTATTLFCGTALALTSGPKSVGFAIPTNATSKVAEVRKDGQSVVITTLAFRVRMQGTF